MKIEDYWKDGTQYYVRFETTTHRFIEKVIVLPSGITLEKAEDLVKKSFNKVERVVELDVGPELLTFTGTHVWQ